MTNHNWKPGDKAWTVNCGVPKQVRLLVPSTIAGAFCVSGLSIGDMIRCGDSLFVDEPGALGLAAQRAKEALDEAEESVRKCKVDLDSINARIAKLKGQQ